MAAEAGRSEDETFVVRFESYEGPIEALLELARSQRVDLAQIDMVALVDQFEAIVGRAMAMRLELAADWLVMAAWLAYLKSKEMLRKPKGGKAEPDADALAFHLRRLDAVKRATDAIAGRRQVGVDWFAPAGSPDGALPSRLGASMHELLAAYQATVSREAVAEIKASPLKPFDLSSVDSAIGSVSASVRGRGWTPLLDIVPAAEGLRLRSNIASHLVAALELTRDGKVMVAQDSADAPIMVKDREVADVA